MNKHEDDDWAQAVLVRIRTIKENYRLKLSKKPFATQIALRLFIDSQTSEAHLNGQITKHQLTQPVIL